MSKTHPESKCPELLANYCDLLLRKTPLSKKLTSEEIDVKLKGVVSFRGRKGVSGIVLVDCIPWLGMVVWFSHTCLM